MSEQYKLEPHAKVPALLWRDGATGEAVMVGKSDARIEDGKLRLSVTFDDAHAALGQKLREGLAAATERGEGLPCVVGYRPREIRQTETGYEVEADAVSVETEPT